MREDWLEILYKDAVNKISTTKYKLKQKEYLQNGIYPVVDQGQSMIGGYTDDKEKLLDCKLPVIIFGDHTKKVKLINFKFAPGADGTKVLEPKKGIHPKYISLLTEILVFKIKDKGYARHYQHIEKKYLPLPPLPIQRAIVSKIETLFSDLDNGIADLKKAQEQLKIYRQAVLKKAFEGELTKEWREQQTDLPTAEELLEQIKEQRQKHYEKQLEDWKQAVKAWEENGKEGKKPGKPKAWKQVEKFTKIELSKLTILPNGWQWVKLGNIFRVFVGSTPSRKENNYWNRGNIKWVSSGEVVFNSIFDTKEKITNDGLVNSSTTVHPIGTVMLAMIGEGKTRGQSAILEVEACHNQNTAAIRVSEMGFEPKFLFHYLFLKYERNRRLGSGNNQKALNQSRIMEFEYPLCSKKEQHQIVQEIESRLSVCDQVEQNITEALTKSEALRQSILKKAFEGKLLSDAEIEACKQEADYEPASVLLERIKKEKK